MQQIKFRVWNGVLHEYRTIDMNSGKQNLGMGFESEEGVGSNTTTIYCSFGDVVEQFTGLTDVNGNDIYEDDIIQYSYQFYEDLFTGAIVHETGYIGTVVKNNGAFGILINRVSYTDAHSNYYHVKDFVPFCEFDNPESDMVLKGNVHENPELLEEE